MQFIKRLPAFVILLLALGLLIPACQDNGSSPNAEDPSLVKFANREVAVKWTDLFLNIERNAAGYRPGGAPRVWALMAMSAYEGCIQGMPEFNSLANLQAGLSLPQPEAGKAYHWPTVVNASYAYLMPKYFPSANSTHQQEIATLKNYFEDKYRNEAGSETFDRSKAYGEAVAAAVFAWSETDVQEGGQKANDVWQDPFAGYDHAAHYDGPGDWVPTYPGPGDGMYPKWGHKRTFSSLTDAQKLCKAPLPYSEDVNSKLYSQALEVYAHNTPSLSYEDEWVGEFWSDDLVNLTFSPGPRWLAIGNQVLELENSNLETALYMHAKVGMAVADAAVACWYSKYYYNVERPQSYINRLIDPNWKPNLYNPLTGEEGLTPSFPAYPSGHSTMGAAGAETLGSIFGYAYAMTDNCHLGRTEFEGTPRTFGSFFEMAQENAWSRVPLGVHFRMDSEEGVAFGTRIGRLVNDMPWQ
jgi:hypothetical protein